jgi:hypothetical protein
MYIQSASLDAEGRHYYECRRGGFRYRWFDWTMWAAARKVSPRLRPVSDFIEYRERSLWYPFTTPDDIRRQDLANLDYPVIVSAEGCLMDGWHRLAKAIAAGLTEIWYVQFSEDPPPDVVMLEEL